MGDRREDTVTVLQLTATKMETMRSKEHGRGPSNHKQRIWKGQHQIKERVGEKMGRMQVFPMSQFFLHPQTLLHLSERCTTNSILISDWHTSNDTYFLCRHWTDCSLVSRQTWKCSFSLFLSFSVSFSLFYSWECLRLYWINTHTTCMGTTNMLTHHFDERPQNDWVFVPTHTFSESLSQTCFRQKLAVIVFVCSIPTVLYIMQALWKDSNGGICSGILHDDEHVSYGKNSLYIPWSTQRHSRNDVWYSPTFEKQKSFLARVKGSKC